MQRGRGRILNNDYWVIIQLKKDLKGRRKARYGRVSHEVTIRRLPYIIVRQWQHCWARIF